MSSLKILHIIWSAEMGGISKVVMHLCEEQQRDPDVHIEVFCAKGKASMFSNFESKGITIKAGKFSGGYRLPFAELKVYQKWMTTFDIIHFHSYNPIIAYLAKKSGKKIVYTEHGNFGIGRKKKFNDVIVGWMQKQFLNNHTNAITFNSAFTQSMAIRRFGLNQVRKDIVYNGVPTSTNIDKSVQQFRKDPSEFIIAAVGRLAEVKRFDRLILAFSKIDNASSRLIIMGSGPEEKKLKNMAQTEAHSHSIQFPGQGNSMQLLFESDLCVVPSQGEAFGLIAIEAYSLGKRVLVFEDGGGVTELVQQLEPESVVKDEKVLAQLLIDIREQPTQTMEQIEKRKQYAAQFSMNRMSNTFKKIYQSI